MWPAKKHPRQGLKHESDHILEQKEKEFSQQTLSPLFFFPRKRPIRSAPQENELQEKLISIQVEPGS